MHAFSKKQTFFLKPFLLTIFLDICYSLYPQNVLSIVLIQDILEKLKVENSSSRHPNGPKMFAFIHNIHIYIYIQCVFICIQFVFIYIQFVFISIIISPQTYCFLVSYFFQTLNFLFLLAYSGLTMLWQCQGSRKGTQSYINMYPFSQTTPSCPIQASTKH